MFMRLNFKHKQYLAGDFGMTKRQLVEILARKNNISRPQAEAFLHSLTETIIKNVSNKQKVSITGFGVFDLGKRAARHGVDPRTQADIHIPAMKMPRFRAGKHFKEAVR
jgi:DNA-binding protein HU-beta